MLLRNGENCREAPKISPLHESQRRSWRGCRAGEQVVAIAVKSAAGSPVMPGELSRDDAHNLLLMMCDSAISDSSLDLSLPFFWCFSFSRFILQLITARDNLAPLLRMLMSDIGAIKMESNRARVIKRIRVQICAKRAFQFREWYATDLT
jgi:hypothetical protein